MSPFPIPYIDIKIGFLKIVLGFVKSPSGSLINNGPEINRGFTRKIYIAPTEKGAAITYTSTGEIYVFTNKTNREVSSCEASGDHNCCGDVYCAYLANGNSGTLSDFERVGIKPYKLKEQVDLQHIKYLTIFADGKVEVQKDTQSNHVKRGLIDVSTRSYISGLNSDFFTAITDDAELSQKVNLSESRFWCVIRH